MVYVFSVGYMYSISLEVVVRVSLPNITRRFPNPFLGPKDVRQLRGLAEYKTTCARVNSPQVHYHYRFLGISRTYFSLQYLSFSDAMVLKFIAPILTGFSAAMFLKEPPSLKQVMAGCKMIQFAPTCSFMGLQCAASLEWC